MTIILGFDPGTNECGWCSIDTRGGAGLPITATFMEAGNVPSNEREVSDLMSAQQPNIVAIENLVGFAYGTKGPGVVAALIASARVAGIIRALAWAQDIEPIDMTASEWRRLVLGRGNATDEHIKGIIPTLIHGFPSRSNVHVRDAAGLALGVAWRRNGATKST